MSDPTCADPDDDRGLLFGLLVLRRDLLDPGTLAADLEAWARDRRKSLCQILLDQGRLDPDRLHQLDSLVEEHLRAAPEPSRTPAAAPGTERQGDGGGPAGRTRAEDPLATTGYTPRSREGQPRPAPRKAPPPVAVETAFS